MLKAFALLVERENRTDSSQGVRQNFWPLVIHTGPEKWNFKSLRMQRAEQLKGLKVEEEQINRIVSRIPDFEFDCLDLAVADLEKLIDLRSEVSCVLGFMGARRDRERAEKVFEGILAKARDNEGIKGQLTNMLASILLLTGHSQPGAVSEGFARIYQQNSERKALVQ